MIKRNNLISRVLQLNIVLSMLLFFSCKEEKMLSEADFLGKWKLSQIVVDGNVKALTQHEMDSLLNFKQIGILELSGHAGIVQRSGWNYDDGMLNIAIHLPASYYIQQITETNLELKRLDFVNGNTISTTTTHFIKAE